MMQSIEVILVYSHYNETLNKQIVPQMMQSVPQIIPLMAIKSQDKPPKLQNSNPVFELKALIHCDYCQSMHFRWQLKYKMCPKMAHSASQIRQEDSYKCPKCMGTGSYTYVVTKAYFEDSPYQEIIQRKTEERVKKRCNACTSGWVHKIEHCCPSGCEDCQYTGIRYNRKWIYLNLNQNMQSKSTLQTEEKSQKKCLVCNEPLALKSSVHLFCGHSYHTTCCDFAQSKRKCPLCDKMRPYWFQQFDSNLKFQGEPSLHKELQFRYKEEEEDMCDSQTYEEE